MTALYSFVFLLGSAVEGAFLLNYQYTYGSTSHILYTGLTEHQAERIAENADVKSVVHLSSLGQLTDPQIGQRSVKLAVTDRDYAQTILSVPTTGRLPEQADEIALESSPWIPLAFPMNRALTSAFCGPIPKERSTPPTSRSAAGGKAPANFTESCAWITEEAAEGLLPGYDDAYASNITLGVTLWQPEIWRNRPNRS